MSRSFVPRLLVALLALAALAAWLPASSPVGAALPPAPARVALLHAAPLAAPDGVTVAVGAAGQPGRPLGSLGFSDTLEYSDVAAGSSVFSLYAGSVDAAALPGATPILTETLALDAGKDYTIVVVGGARGHALDLLPLLDSTQPPAGPNGKLRLVHAAPLAAAPATAAVDIVTENGEAVPGLLNVPFKGVSDYITRASGVTYDYKAVPTGKPVAPAVFDVAPLSLAPGEVATLVAVGGANGRPVQVIRLAPKERGPARLRVVHAAPFGEAGSPVQLSLNDKLLWGGLTVGTLTEEIELPEGPYSLTVAQPGDPPGFLASAEAQLARGVSYLALIRPRPDGQGVMVSVERLGADEEPGQAPPGPGQGRLIVYHTAPFVTGVRSRLEVRDRFGELIHPSSNSLSFGERLVVDIPAREYDLRITAPGGEELVVDVDPFTLMEGEEAFVFILGSEGGKPANVVVIAEPVDARVYLPLVGR